MAKTIGVVLSLKDAFTPNIKKVAKELKLSEKQLKTATNEVRKFQSQCAETAKKAVVGLAAAATTAAVTVYGMAQKTAEAGDRVDKLSQKIGMGRVAFQEWDYIMSQNGGNVESLKMGYKTLASQMEMVTKGNKDSIEYFKKLGVSVKDNTGHLKSQDEVFNDTIRALQNIKNPTEKAIIGQKLLGKSFLEMKPLLNQSAKSIDELRQKAHDYGMIMSDDTVDAAVVFTDSMDTLNRSIQGIGYQIGAGFIPIVQQLVNKVQANMPAIKAVALDAAGKLNTVIGFLSNNIHNIIPVIGAAVSAFAAFKVVYGVASGMKALIVVMGNVAKMGGILNALWISNPIGLVAGAIALLVGGIVYAYNKFEGFRNCVQAVWSVMRLWNTICIQVCKSVWNVIGPVVKVGLSIAAWITPVGIVINLFKQLVGLLGKIGGFRGIGKAVKNWADGKRKDLEDGIDKVEKEDGDIPSNDNPPPKPPHHALGTQNFSGGPTYMNEGGKGEIAVLPRGSVIYPHDLSKKMVGNKSIVFSPTIVVQGNMIGNEQYADMLMALMFGKLKIALGNI